MTAPWSYTVLPAAERALHRLDATVRERILTALRRLIEHPAGLGGDVRKLQAHEDEWRLRIGDWRVRFVRDPATRTITVLAVAPRGRPYRG